MANQSIKNAFERMWYHVTTAINEVKNSKANIEHYHDSEDIAFESSTKEITGDNIKEALESADLIISNMYTDINSKAPTNHASTGTSYGKGTGSNYGHVKLSDSTTGTSGASGGIAATPAAVNTVNTHVTELENNLNDALETFDEIITVMYGDDLDGENIPPSIREIAEEEAAAAKSYTDEKIDAIVGTGASETLDTIGEISAAIEGNQSMLQTLNSAVGNKANKTDLENHTTNKNNPHGVTKAQIGLTNVEDKSSATIRSEITKANVGNALGFTTNSTTKYLKEDGTWETPPDNDTTYSVMSAASSTAAGSEGLVPAPAKGKQSSFLRGDGTWATPSDVKMRIYRQTSGYDEELPLMVSRTAASGIGTEGTNGGQAAVYGVFREKSTSDHSPTLTANPAQGTISATIFKGNLEGNAATASNLANISIGTKYFPVYFDKGVPVQCAYELNESVPEGAIFTDTHYESATVVGASSSAKTDAAVAASTNSIYLNHIENGEVKSTHNIIGKGSTKVSSDANGKITIESSHSHTITTESGTTEANSGNAVSVVSAATLKVVDDGILMLDLTSGSAAPNGHTHSYVKATGTSSV